MPDAQLDETLCSDTAKDTGRFGEMLISGAVQRRVIRTGFRRRLAWKGKPIHRGL